MKNQLHHTLLPLTAVLLILGLSLQVMLHLRQKSALQHMTSDIATVTATLHQTDLLTQAWNSKTRAAHLPQTASQQDQTLAGALLQLRRLTAANAGLQQQVQATELYMMRSETVADSLQWVSGVQAGHYAQTLMRSTDQPVALALQGLKEKLQAMAQAQTAEYLTVQKRSEDVTLNSLAITLVAFVAFLYFLLQDFRLLRQQQTTLPTTGEAATTQPAAEADANMSGAAAFTRSAYRRQLLLESLAGKSEQEPKMALPVKK